ncbi:MAG: TolC family protein [Flavobacteriaceae bacterium]
MNCAITTKIIILTTLCNISAQNITTSKFNQDNFLEHYKKNRSFEIDTLLNSTKNKNSFAWLNLLPSINYDLDQNSFNVSISLNTFAQYAQQKKRNEIEILRLKESLESSLNNKLLSIENQYLNIKLDLSSLQYDLQNFEINNQLYHLKKAQYHNNKINLESWLKFQQDYLKSIAILDKKINALDIRIQNLQKKINTPHNLPELTQLASLRHKLNAYQHD